MREILLAGSIGRSVSVRDYLLLFKPGIVGLVLVSTLTGLYLGSLRAGGGGVDPSVLLLIFWTLSGVGLATAGAGALNNFFDRDIDSLMQRTASRALVTGVISPPTALMAGLLMVAGSMAILGVAVNPLTASITFIAVFVYVVLYAMVLKRRSSWANQVGGIAGALPPVIGIAAATGTIGVEAIVLFAIVALWQQPHALSLALKYRRDYEAAGVPAVPVAKGVNATKKRILLYTLLLLPVSLLPVYFSMAGRIYLAVGVTSGLLFIAFSAKFLLSARESSINHFFFTILYLTVLFTAMVLDMVV